MRGPHTQQPTKWEGGHTRQGHPSNLVVSSQTSSRTDGKLSRTTEEYVGFQVSRVIIVPVDPTIIAAVEGTTVSPGWSPYSCSTILGLVA
jgi:hypothetical protein